MSKNILSVLVENHAGVLNRITGLFSRRGYNIESITAGVTSNPNITRMTVVIEEDESTIEQIVKQLEKQYVVKKVKLLTSKPMCREMVLIKLDRTSMDLEVLSTLIDRPGNRVVNLGENSITIEVTGSQEEIDNMLSSIKRSVILETARTGMIAMECGDACLQLND